MFRHPLEIAILLVMYIIIVSRLIFIFFNPTRLQISMILTAVSAISFGSVAFGILLTPGSLERFMPMTLFMLISAGSVVGFVKFRNEFLSLPGKRERTITLPEESYKFFTKVQRVSRRPAYSRDVTIFFLQCQHGTFRMFGSPRFDGLTHPEINVTFWEDGTCRINYPFNGWDVFEIAVLIMWALSPIFASTVVLNGGFPPENPSLPYSGAYGHILMWGVIAVMLMGRRLLFAQNRVGQHVAFRVGAALICPLLFIGQIIAIFENVRYFHF